MRKLITFFAVTLICAGMLWTWYNNLDNFDKILTAKQRFEMNKGSMALILLGLFIGWAAKIDINK